VAAGRVLVVHESGATRAQLVDLLTREGLRVEAVPSTFDAITRFVEEPAEIVVLGLGGLEPRELDLIRALIREEPRPRMLVTFPSPRRDLAVRALVLGASAYALEPFYPDEIVGLVRGLRSKPAPEKPGGALARLAEEVAHAVNNPLQVLSFLVAKDKVTKKEVLDTVPPSVERIRKVVAHLKDFAQLPAGTPEPQDARPVVERAAEQAAFAFEAKATPPALLHKENFAAALKEILAAIRARVGEEPRPTVELSAEADAIAVRAGAPREAFADEKMGDLLDLPFVLKRERDIYPSLARARLLLEGMGGSLAVEHRGDVVQVVARVPLAK
jgi:DNA-binding response OmpR family regulator